MKKTALILPLAMSLLPLLSFDNSSLEGHAMPLLPAKTLDGRTIDENYYKGHVTIVSFMFIGCLPCMNEISTLNKIKEAYAASEKLQILCVARQMREQMAQFNSTDNTTYPGMIRKALNADPIQYSIQPACDDAASKMVINGDAENKHVDVKSECSTIEEKYGVNSFPTLFYVDKNGIIRKIEAGGPPTKNDPDFYNRVKKEIDLLLAE